MGEPWIRRRTQPFPSNARTVAGGDGDDGGGAGADCLEAGESAALVKRLYAASARVSSEPPPRWLGQLARALTRPPPNGGSTAMRPELLPRELLSYQREAVAFALARGGRALLADEMGLGKVGLRLIAG